MCDNVATWLHWMFGGDFPTAPLAWYQVAARATLVYLMGMAAMRVGKSRMLGRMTAIDVVLGFILGSLLSRGINGAGSLSGTLAGSAMLVFLHWNVTYVTCRSHRLSQLLKGHIRPLVIDGVVDQHNMRRAHMSHDDLLEELRLNGNVDDMRQVKAAYKERNGEVGVVRQPSEPRVVNIDIAAGVQHVRIELAT